MTFAEFNRSLSLPIPPEALSTCLQVLWLDGKNDWSKAHDLAQNIDDDDGSWLHAYLHRKEGDDSNARYWYRRAGKSTPVYSLQQEWDEIVGHFLQQGV